MTYFLDTNACIALINGTPNGVRSRLERAVTRGDEMLLSSIVMFELWCGVSKSKHKDANTRRLEAFIAGPLVPVSLDDEDALEAGAIRAELESKGKPIGAYDVLIAGQARRRGASVVTANASEFSRVPDLKWENWATGRK